MISRIACTDSHCMRDTTRTMLRTIAIVAMALLTIGLLTGCARDADEERKTLTVATTYAPLLYFTRAVAGPDAQVISLIPNGIDPHSYTPSASDLRALEDADMLVVLGTERQILAARRPNIFTVHALARIPLLSLGEDDEHAHEHADTDEHAHDEDEHEHADTDEHEHDEHEHEDTDEYEHGEEHAHAHGTVDIHAWLSPRYAITMVRNIMEGLIVTDIERSSYYQQNAATYIEELSELAQDMEAQFSNCSQDYILVTHNAFSYLANEYDFHILSIYDAEPDIEPSAGKFVSLITGAKENNIKYMFYDELFDSRIPESIAEQLGATLLPLYSLEYAPSENSTYFSIMNTNTDNLVTALQCQ